MNDRIHALLRSKGRNNTSVSAGRTSRAELEQTVGREIGGYLSRLEAECGLVAKRQPLFTRSSTKLVRYGIVDPFFIYWFRFPYKYGYMAEIGAYEKLREVVTRDWPVFGGFALERFARTRLAESGEWTRIGSWWDRKGENEIDLIAENELEKRAVFYEVKRDPSRYSEFVLRRQSRRVPPQNRGFPRRSHRLPPLDTLKV